MTSALDAGAIGGSGMALALRKAAEQEAAAISFLHE